MKASRNLSPGYAYLHFPELPGMSEVEEALVRCGGAVVSVTDDEIAAAWRSLAREEGVFCEPASAAAVAGLVRAGVAQGQRVVCVLTGHGLKDPDAFDRLPEPGS